MTIQEYASRRNDQPIGQLDPLLSGAQFGRVHETAHVLEVQCPRAVRSGANTTRGRGFCLNDNELATVDVSDLNSCRVLSWRWNDQVETGAKSKRRTIFIPIHIPRGRIERENLPEEWSKVNVGGVCEIVVRLGDLIESGLRPRTAIPFETFVEKNSLIFHRSIPLRCRGVLSTFRAFLPFSYPPFIGHCKNYTTPPITLYARSF